MFKVIVKAFSRVEKPEEQCEVDTEESTKARDRSDRAVLALAAALQETRPVDLLANLLKE